MVEDDDGHSASLVFIYGPPGVGKLTVARDVVALTGARLFDNHMSIDWAQQIFPRRDAAGIMAEPFMLLRDRFRLAVFEEAMRARTDIVTTFVYADGADLPYVNRVCDVVDRQGGRVCFIQLLCDPDEHEQRVQSPGRREVGKMSTATRLREFMGGLNVVTPVPGRESLRIDTTGLPAAEVAQRITEHFGLSSAALPGTQKGRS